MRESFRYIDKTNKRYKVSNFGKVMSNYRKGEWRQINPTFNPNGHPYVTLVQENKTVVSMRICVLVYEAFVDKVGKARIKHKDGNILNNTVENLYITHFKNKGIPKQDYECERYIKFNAENNMYEVDFVIKNKRKNIGFSTTYADASKLYYKYLNEYISNQKKLTKDIVVAYLSNNNNAKLVAQQFGLTERKIAAIIRRAKMESIKNINIQHVDFEERNPVSNKHICEITFDDLSINEHIDYHHLVQKNGVITHRQEPLRNVLNDKILNANQIKVKKEAAEY